MCEESGAELRYQYKNFLDALPTDWEKKPISQLGAVVGGGTPSRDVPSFWHGTIPWVTPGEVSGEAAKHLHDTADHISAAGLAGSGANLLPTGSLMVTTRATLGARAINAVPMATNQGFKSVVFRQVQDADYYFHLFEKVKPELVRRGSGTTFLEVSSAEFGAILVPSPLRDEKQQIAEILDTVDTAIQLTQSIIATLKAVKQGLLYDLLTRGIDVNGEIRPPQPEAPNLYQDSPLGWLPKEWEYSKLGTRVLFLGGYGFPERFQNLREEEVPFFKVSDQSTPGNERELRASNNYVSFERAAKQGWKLLPKGGVAFAKVGAALLLNRRRILTQDSLVDNNMMVAVAQDSVQNNWLYWFLNSVDFSRFVQPGALPSVNQAQLSSVPVGFPRPAEQSAISDRLDESDKRLDFEMHELGKLLQLKAGLMDDLLTGRVRVTSLLREELQAGGD
jgi:type I restriction enzyme S subunit